MGVRYTPREIVRYMVARVDRALRDDLGIAKGLADERVFGVEIMPAPLVVAHLEVGLALEQLGAGLDGYQVLKKWHSYRESKVLGRGND